MHRDDSLAARMKREIGGRYRLTKSRIKHRLPVWIVVSVFAGVLATTAEWMGYAGSFRKTGIPTPKSLGEIWWHPLLIAAICLVGYPLWPFREWDE
jgi:hypothetical protein